MRIPTYEFSKEVPNEVQEAIEDVRMLLNNGKYVPGKSTIEPTYTGEDCEFKIVRLGPTDVYMFAYVNDQWWYSKMTAGPLP